MDEEELISKTSYLLRKYLDSERAEEVIDEFRQNLNRNRNIGKEVLHILSSEKLRDIEKVDRNIVKDIAYNLGV